MRGTLMPMLQEKSLVGPSLSELGSLLGIHVDSMPRPSPVGYMLPVSFKKLPATPKGLLIPKIEPTRHSPEVRLSGTL